MKICTQTSFHKFSGCSDDLNKKKITKNSLKLPKDSVEVGAEKPCISIDEKLINKLCDA